MQPFNLDGNACSAPVAVFGAHSDIFSIHAFLPCAASWGPCPPGCEHAQHSWGAMWGAHEGSVQSSCKVRFRVGCIVSIKVRVRVMSRIWVQKLERTHVAIDTCRLHQ